MAGWNGSGTFSRTHDWTEDQGNGIKIRADRHDDNDVDFVSGINNTMTKDGQNSATADLDMGGNKLKNGKTATLVGDFPIVSDIQNSVQTHVTSTGSANAYVVTLAPAPAAYVAGQKFTFKANFATTGAATVNINALGAKTIKKDGDTTDLVTNDIVADQIVEITYDGTVFQSDVAVTTLLDDLTPQLGGFLDPNSNYIGWNKGADTASASPLVVLTDGNMWDVTGTTNFAAMTVAANRKGTFQFDGILTVTNGASLLLPGGANITTAAGDVWEWQSTAADTVLVTSVTKADGTAVVAATPGSMVLLSTQTASTSATIDFDNTFITGTYTHYKVVIEDALPATDDVRMGIRYSQASSFITSGYVYINDTVRNATAFVSNSVSNDRILCHAEGVSNVSTEGAFNSTMDFYGVGASKPTAVTGLNFAQNASASTWDISDFGGTLVSTTAIDGIQFLFASGTIISGKFKLYGIL